MVMSLTCARLDSKNRLIAGNFGTDTVTLPLEKQADRVLLTNGKAVDEILNGNSESASLVLGSCDCVVLLLGQ